MISAKFLWDMYFWEETTNWCKKFKFWNFWERPLYEVSEYAFNCFTSSGKILNSLEIAEVIPIHRKDDK